MLKPEKFDAEMTESSGITSTMVLFAWNQIFCPPPNFSAGYTTDA